MRTGEHTSRAGVANDGPGVLRLGLTDIIPNSGARRLQEESGLTMKQDGSAGFRRVVASPQPVEIIEVPAIKVGPVCAPKQLRCCQANCLLPARHS